MARRDGQTRVRTERRKNGSEGGRGRKTVKKNCLFGLSGCWTLLIVELIKNQVGEKCYRLDAQGLSCRTHNPTNTHTCTHTHSPLILRELKPSSAKHSPSKLSPAAAACVLLISLALPYHCINESKLKKKHWGGNKKIYHLSFAFFLWLRHFSRDVMWHFVCFRVKHCTVVLCLSNCCFVNEQLV